ncbi:response regulator [Sphaerospermopsis aphanizomenoides BCCUSP55]|uniref:response regulator n=1 Tax=Sphaerospermopsis aphanizomenoides TaxID=459663 RepID=UPI0019089D81|nr:response regulator [Sphaerospermopsis aphanizomenoides]MBK1990676.1 response regulator [Sphaerospermopsis aphanizomenoides BCCUSP55]
MKNKRLLIIDDEERIRELVQICLQQLGGWDTIAADTSKDALEIAKAQFVDAILLDVSMPDMSGLIVYEELQANPHTQSIPIILLTAKVLPSDLTRFAQMKIAGIITKPFKALTLAQEIAQILGWDDKC